VRINPCAYSEGCTIFGRVILVGGYVEHSETPWVSDTDYYGCFVEVVVVVKVFGPFEVSAECLAYCYCY
jgi:hypothetical protein